jgi:hypothetical protein
LWNKVCEIGDPFSVLYGGVRHDPLFKTLIRTFLPDLLSLTVPEIVPHLRLSGAVYLDKEFFLEGPRGGRREADLLVRIPLRRRKASLLIHVELEVRERRGMPQRLRGYHSQIQGRYDSQVVSILVCLRARRAGVSAVPLPGLLSGPTFPDFRYVTFGLSGCAASEYLDRPEPLAWALAALMRPGTWGRAEHKLACLRRIARSGLDDGRKLLLADCVEMYLELTTKEASEYEALVAQEPHREVRAVQMTWSQRIKAEGFRLGRQEGRKVGRKEGREDGMRQLLLHLLEQRFGPLPEAVRLKVEAIDSPRRLTQLSGQVLVASSLEELGLR